MIATDLSPARTRRPGFAALGLLAVALLPLGCGGDDEPASSAPGGGGGASKSAASVENTVDVDGSSTVFRISDRAREAFSEVDPKFNLIVGNHGTGGGRAATKGAISAATEDEELAKTQGIGR